jgi:carbonic anhydrase/acetyltransferase-like protein (isoleucine patch superfamily)
VRGRFELIDTRATRIGRSAFIDRSASILGDVTIGDDVYVAPNASIRADEPGSSIVIGNECNIQDNVVIHALRDSTVDIGPGTTLGHGSIVHGPCTVGEGCFIGFGAVVFKCTLMDGCVVLHRAVVTKALIPPFRLVGIGDVIEGDLKAIDLPRVTEDISRFVASVRQTNVELAKTYREASERRASARRRTLKE